MKRIVLVAVLVVVLGAAFGPAPASAGGPSYDVTVTLSCDKGVSAAAAIDVTADDGFVTVVYGLVCGDAKSVRQSVPLSAAASTVTVTAFTVSTSSDGCADPNPQQLAARIDCPSSGRGARLVVR